MYKPRPKLHFSRILFDKKVETKCSLNAENQIAHLSEKCSLISLFFFEIPDLPFVLKNETSSTLVPIVHFLFSDKMENHPLSKSIISDLVMGDNGKKNGYALEGDRRFFSNSL